VVLDGVRAIALHEVGHLVGLDHPTDQTSVMAAQVLVTQINEADRRTARLIYDLPPGRLLP
jgi:predicted Zn-dependent protease